MRVYCTTKLPVIFEFLNTNMCSLQLSRNTIKLAVQPLERLASNARMPNISLLWRAILEVMLQDRAVDPDNRNVGRIASKCEDFVQYVR